MINKGGRPRGDASNCVTIEERKGILPSGTPRSGYFIHIGLNVDDLLGNPQYVDIQKYGPDMTVIRPGTTHKVSRTPGNRPYVTVNQEDFDRLNLETGQFYTFRVMGDMGF